MQVSSTIRSEKPQLDALENGCGMVRWNNTAIIQHSGPDALDLLHRLTTNDLLPVTEGHARRTVLTTDRGRVVDVFLVAQVSENRLLLISDSDKPERTISAIDYYTIMEDAKLADLSGSHTRISLIGPQAVEIAETVLGLEMGPGRVETVEYASAPVIAVSDTSRGVEWVDVVFENNAGDVGDPGHNLEARFESAGAVMVDRDNFELFRINHQIPGSDEEYGEHANPIESGLLDLIDFDKGCYVGQEVIARLDTYEKVKRNLKVLESDGPLEAGMNLQLPVDSKPAGTITSASPVKTEDGTHLALGLVRKAFLTTGTVLDSNGITVRVR